MFFQNQQSKQPGISLDLLDHCVAQEGGIPTQDRPHSASGRSGGYLGRGSHCFFK